MRQLLLGIFSFSFFIASSQDIQTVQRSIASNDYLSAKKQIDDFFADKKNITDAPGWYYKGRVYAEVVRQHDTLNHALLKDAFNSYKRYQELDPKNKMMQLNSNVDLFQLYDLSYNLGAQFYNDKRYDLAYNYFRNALEVEEYVFKKGFSFQGKSFPAFDTSLINLIASAAYLSRQEDESILYFEKLANLKLAGEEFKGVYALLYQHYTKKNDQVKAAKYLGNGKTLFPDNDFWLKLELGNLGSEKERFNRYEQLLQKYPGNFTVMMDYAVELFNYEYADIKPTDFATRQDRLQLVLTKALSADPYSALANFVMSQHVYNQVYDMEELLRGMKEDTPAEQNKKKTFSAKLDQKWEELLTYSLKAYDIYSQNLETANKDNCKKLLNQLISYYQKKKMGDKVGFYQERLKAL